jgi:hypothetical protein
MATVLAPTAENPNYFGLHPEGSVLHRHQSSEIAKGTAMFELKADIPPLMAE